VSFPILPVPVRGEGGGAPFVIRPGTGVGCTDPGLVPLVERFCAEVERRVALRLTAIGGEGGGDEPAVRVELGGACDLDGLPAPRGLSPLGGDPADERHMLASDGEHLVVRGVSPTGIARGLTTLVQLLATAPAGNAGEIVVPGWRIVDAPRYAWRGLSLDLARTFFPLDAVRRVVDLLALYKLNVLHLHLTDDQGWRLPAGRPAGTPDDGCYTAAEIRSLVAYAADRFVTVVPEVDTPGHTSALVAMHPTLHTGRNEVRFELPPGHAHRATWLDPELTATFALVEEVLAGTADLFPTPYFHIGGDEPFGMPHDLYTSYVGRLRDLVRSLGKRPVGWQESARAGLGPDDVIQYWFTDIPVPAKLPPEVRARLDADLALSRQDVEAAAAAAVPVIVSPLGHCYLDVPYAEPAPDPAQADRQRRLGLRLYQRRTVAASFDWSPGETLGPGREGLVAGVEAAIWAETIRDTDDLTFLLLPRLPGIAQKAWGDPTTPWTDHRARLTHHGRLWDQDALTYFRSSIIDWE
jgi:hexosaminidase